MHSCNATCIRYVSYYCHYKIPKKIYLYDSFRYSLRTGSTDFKISNLYLPKIKKKKKKIKKNKKKKSMKYFEIQ
jgi:hypothetical protein